MKAKSSSYIPYSYSLCGHWNIIKNYLLCHTIDYFEQNFHTQISGEDYLWEYSVPTTIKTFLITVALYKNKFVVYMKDISRHVTVVGNMPGCALIPWLYPIQFLGDPGVIYFTVPHYFCSQSQWLLHYIRYIDMQHSSLEKYLFCQIEI